jgi:hypothetical protein
VKSLNERIGTRIHWKIVDFNKVSCPADDVSVYLNQQARPYAECDAWHAWAIAEINRLKPSIFMVTNETGYRVTAGGTLKDGLVKTLQSVTSPGTQKMVLGDIPYLQVDGPDCLAAHMGDVQACSTPEPAAINVAGRQAEMAGAAAASATYIDVVPWFCSSVCTAVVGNMIINDDQQHVDKTYAGYLTGAMQAAIQPQVDRAGA